MAINEKAVGDDQKWKRNVEESDRKQDDRIAVLEQQVAQLIQRVNK